MQCHAVPIAAADHPPCCVHQQGFQAPAVGYLQAFSNFLLTLLVKYICTNGRDIPQETQLRSLGLHVCRHAPAGDEDKAGT